MLDELQYPKNRRHLGFKYERYDNDNRPKLNDVCYLLPQQEDGQKPPMKCTIIFEGFDKKDLVEVKQKHPKFLVDLTIKKMGKQKGLAHLKHCETNFLPVECLYKRIGRVTKVKS